jgi:hypothetical protein
MYDEVFAAADIDVESETLEFSFLPFDGGPIVPYPRSPS